MKKMILVILSITSLSGFALECSVDKNQGQTVVKFQTIPDLTDEEEQLEENGLDIDSIQISVMYLPYQEGIYINVYDQNNKEIASDSSHDKLELVVKESKNEYKIKCIAD